MVPDRVNNKVSWLVAGGWDYQESMFFVAPNCELNSGFTTVDMSVQVTICHFPG